MIAGAGGGLVASIATCPLDVIKTELQAQRHSQGQKGYEGVINTFGSVWRHTGLKGFYRGPGPTMPGYLPTWAIYFAVYDGIKSTFGKAPLGVQDPPPPAVSKFGTPVVTVDDRGGERVIYPTAQPKGYQPVAREHPWGQHIMSATTAGATSTMCT